MEFPSFNVHAHVMNESRGLCALEDVSERHGGELHGPGIESLVISLHFVLWDSKSIVDNTTPFFGRPKLHPLASFTKDDFFENLAGAILHVSRKCIDTDPSPPLLFKRFCIRHECAVSRSHIQEESILHTWKNSLGHPLVLTCLRIK